MVELFYYETRGKCCRKVFRHEGFPAKILLFPYEGWAQPALMSYCLLKTYWWSRSRVKITYVTSSQQHSAKGRMRDNGKGTVVITGKFKETRHSDFRMFLTTNVDNADFNLGYCVTGTLEQGDKDSGELQLTHFAMIKRKAYQSC